MHRLPSKSAIRRFRVASLLLWVNYLLSVVPVIFLIYAFIEKSEEHIKSAIIFMMIFIGSLVLQWIISLQTRCPLCITPVLAVKSCSKNKKARTFLGSYRLRVANNILLRNYFRCPYCSEPTELTVRTKQRGQRRPGHPRH